MLTLGAHDLAGVTPVIPAKANRKTPRTSDLALIVKAMAVANDRRGKEPHRLRHLARSQLIVWRVVKTAGRPFPLPVLGRLSRA